MSLHQTKFLVIPTLVRQSTLSTNNVASEERNIHHLLLTGRTALSCINRTSLPAFWTLHLLNNWNQDESHWVVRHFLRRRDFHDLRPPPTGLDLYAAHQTSRHVRNVPLADGVARPKLLHHQLWTGRCPENFYRRFDALAAMLRDSDRAIRPIMLPGWAACRTDEPVVPRVVSLQAVGRTTALAQRPQEQTSSLQLSPRAAQAHYFSQPKMVPSRF